MPAKRLAILLSGRGSNFAAIANNVKAGKLDAEIAVVISNRTGAPGLEMAQRLGIPAECLPSYSRPREEYDRELLAKLKPLKVDLICLAGFMRYLTPLFIREYPLRILNIHPSLLPAFPGLDAQAQALAHGVKISGCTVHFVDEQLDAGPIILQSAVPVLDDDTPETLGSRILEQEHRIYSEAIGLVAHGRVRIEGRRVILK